MFLKRFIPAVLALAMVVSCFTFASAEEPIVPVPNTISVVVQPVGYGTASSVNSALPGTPVTVTATPASELVAFIGWSGNVEFADATAAQTVFVMPNEPVVISANFALRTNQVIPVTDGGGYILLNNNYFQIGETVTLRAVPNEGFAFYTWVSDDVSIAYPGNDMIQFIMPAHDVEIYAVFAIKQPEVKETVSVTFDSMGGTDFGTKYVEVGGYIQEPTNVPIKEGYTFAGWYSDSTCTLPYNFSAPLYTTTIIYAKWAALEDTSTNSFVDVNESDWFYDCVMTLAERNIISGMGNSVFAPDKNVSRAQFATILANLAGANLLSAETPFNDVAEDAWYAKAVAWAYNNGIVNGKSSAQFAPNDNVSRQDMAVMIKRYVENVAKVTLVESNAQSAFSDDSDIAAYASDAVYAMQRAGIINGKNGNVFDPMANAKRSEAAKMIYVLLKLIEL